MPEGARFCSSVRPAAGQPGRRAPGGHGAVRRPGRLHHAVRDRAIPSRSRTWSTAASSGSCTTSTTFGGRVDKIIGDAIVALFGAPVAHEDDAERAVRAALRMQETLAAYRGRASARRSQVRIGVNTGEVLVGALRAGGDYTAMGDVVNTAQRLQTAAAARRGRGRARPPTPPPARSSRYRVARRRSTPRAARSRSRPGSPSSRCCRPGYRPRRVADARSSAATPSSACSATPIDAAVERRRGPPRCCCSARPASARPAWPRSWPPCARVRPRRPGARGPLRALRRGQRVVAGRRGAAPGLRHRARRRRCRRPSRAAPTRWPARWAEPADVARGRARRQRAALPDGLRGPAARDRSRSGPARRPPGPCSPSSRRSARTSPSWSCSPTCTGPTTLVLELLDALLDA